MDNTEYLIKGIFDEPEQKVIQAEAKDINIVKTTTEEKTIIAEVNFEETEKAIKTIENHMHHLENKFGSDVTAKYENMLEDLKDKVKRKKTDTKYREALIKIRDEFSNGVDFINGVLDEKEN